MEIRTGSGRWLALLVFLLLPACDSATGAPLEELLAPVADVRELRIVQRLIAEDGELVMFYYIDAAGERWLAVAEVRQHDGGGWTLNRRHSALAVTDDCRSPCTTYDVETDQGIQQVLLYGYTQDPGVEAVEIELYNGRTLTLPVTARTFVGIWSDVGTGPGGPNALYRKIREIDE